MIESLLLLITAFVFVLFIASIHWESEILAIMNIALYLYLGIAHVQIQIPYVVIDSGDTVTEAIMLHSDFGAAILMWFFAFISAALFVMFRIKHKEEEAKELKSKF